MSNAATSETRLKATFRVKVNGQTVALSRQANGLLMAGDRGTLAAVRHLQQSKPSAVTLLGRLRAGSHEGCGFIRGAASSCSRRTTGRRRSLPPRQAGVW